ncbi:hypothetical protein ACFLUZ_06115 [Chloroflexota bacterium]
MKRLLRLIALIVTAIITLLVCTVPVLAGNGADVDHDNWNKKYTNTYLFPWGTITEEIVDKGVWHRVSTPSGNDKYYFKGIEEVTTTFDYGGGNTESYYFKEGYKNSFLVKPGGVHLDKLSYQLEFDDPWGTYWEIWKYQWVNGKVVKYLDNSGYTPK